jgi:tRNA (guanine6-N2)-methyltransferase
VWYGGDMNETSYYVMTMPGLETVAFSEIHARIPDAQLVKFARGIAVFQATTTPRDLLALRTTEDVFVMLTHITKLGRGPDALRVIHSATGHADIAGALAQWRRLHGGTPPRSWRIVSQKEGEHEFRRVDAGKAVSDALQRALPKGMRLVADDADVEFWLWLHGSEALVGMRLSDATMRHRTYKHEHLPASLRPTVAATMSWLAQPTATDVVLDPLCGAGTILIERSLMSPLARAIGGDARTPAVEMARHNAHSAYVKLELHTWDAQKLPLDDHGVTRIITNLPFGKQVGALSHNATLYPALAQEFARVLAPDGLLVTLTSDDRLWDAALREQGWRIEKKVVMVVLGQPASIFVARPRQGA